MIPRNLQGSQAPQDAHSLRKKVLADGNTAEIARVLAITTEEYVDQVMHFLLSPTQEPWLYVIEDEDLPVLGLVPPDREEMGRFIMEAAQRAEAEEGRLEFLPPLAVVRFSQSPFSKLLTNVGLSSVMGGANGLLGRGLSTLRRQGGGKLLETFQSFATQFLALAHSILISPGLWGIAGFLSSAANSAQLLPMARVVFSVCQSVPAPDDSTRHLIQHNLTQLFAHHHAQLMV